MAETSKCRGVSGLLLACVTAASIVVTAFAAGATTPTPTPTRFCPAATPEPFYVDPVVSPTDELTQTVYVQIGNGDGVEVVSEAGTFVGAEPFNRVNVQLLPNTANHLQVNAHVRTVVHNGCTYGGYTLSTTTDLHGAPLTIVQGTMHGPIIAIEPPTLTLSCSGAFDIVLRNVSEGDEVLEISFISLHHAYSQGYYGTGFTWDTSAIELPLTLSPGASVSIPVSYRGDKSRLVLQVVSNARNNHATQYVSYNGNGCPTPTPTFAAETATATPTSTPDPNCPSVVDLTPSTGPAGTITVMKGRCYWIHSGRSAEVYLDDVFLGYVSGLTGGDFRTLILIPPATTSGVHTIRLSQAGHDLASGIFDVTRPPGPCTGDCNHDEQVDVDEVVTSVGIALGRLDPSDCRSAGTIGDDVTIADLVAAVRNTLQGCPTSPELESFSGAYSVLAAWVDELAHPDEVWPFAGETSVVDGEVFLRIEHFSGTFEVSGVPDEDGRVTLEGTYEENEANPIPVSGSAVLSQTQSDEWISGELTLEPPEPLVSRAVRFSMQRQH